MADTHILGISYGGYDPSACLLKNGRLLTFMEEDRFVRVKHARGHFPSNAISFCLGRAGVSVSGLDYISVWWDADKYPERMAEHFRSISEAGHVKDPGTLRWEASCLERFTRERMAADIARHFRASFGDLPLPPLDFVRHHLCHAITAHHYSGFGDASVLTIDGSGEENATVLWKGGQRGLEELEAFNIPHSLGWFYSGMTEYLGFKPYGGEGKVMGLAPYGKADGVVSAKMDRIVQAFPDGSYSVDPSYIFYGTHSHGERFTDRLVDEIGMPPRKADGPVEPYAGVAFHAQQRLEEAVSGLARRLVGKTSSGNLCLSGGVAYNCKMNGRLREMPEVDDLFVFPISGDSGAIIGAALATHERHFSKPKPERLEHVYYGIEFSDDEIKGFLDSKGARYSFQDDIAGVAGELLARGKVVGWFQGRQEGGPRALGNRSILADPRDAAMKERVNRTVKNREPWRPFAPSILRSAMGEYIEDASESPFMIVSYKAMEGKAREIPAVVHVDGSVRPQTVRREANPLFWSLIKSFEERTSVPVVLNTSFNKRGEPVVCSPEDAYSDFVNSEMDALAIGHYLLEKK